MGPRDKQNTGTIMTKHQKRFWGWAFWIVWCVFLYIMGGVISRALIFEKQYRKEQELERQQPNLDYYPHYEEREAQNYYACNN